MEKKENIDKIDISIYKGDKIFNENTPFLLNISSPESNKNREKYNNIDIICVIDTSRSMNGQKIFQVKQSLKILIDLMKEKDRIALITFNEKAKMNFNLLYLTEINKKALKRNIDLLLTEPGTNILSGLEIAVNILKDIKKENQKERISSVILLSDGFDMVNKDIELIEKFKSLTKNFNLSFTLHTFGYGYKHDAKLMQKLASIRDGAFYYVEYYEKVSEYFACVLGGCFSALSKSSDLSVKLLNENCKLIKVFGVEYLYKYELLDNSFTTSILQFIRGKEYSYVFEIKIDEEKVKENDELLKVEFTYENINNQKTITINEIYKYKLNQLDNIIANEEYIRSQTYFILDEAMKLKERGEKEMAREKINKMRDWIKNNYKGNNKKLLSDLEKSYDLFEKNQVIVDKSCVFLRSEIMQNQYKKQGSDMNYINQIQKDLITSVSFPIQFKSFEKNNNNLMKSMVFK